jgi:hypothetical protein
MRYEKGLLRRIALRSVEHSRRPTQTYHQLRDWLEQMSLSDEGLATLSNLLHDFRKNRFERVHEVRAFAGELEDAWCNRAPDANPCEVFKQVLARHYCHGYQVPASSTKSSRVMDALDFRDRHLLPRVAGLPVTGKIGMRALRRLEKAGLAGVVKPSTFGNRRGFAWITREDVLESVRSARDATKARDLLGLTHVQQHQHIIEVRYPEGSLEQVRLCSPTFIEGCPSLIYRSTVSADGWGRSVDLGAEALDEGAPEAVHEGVPFSDHFAVADLGLVLTPPRNASPDAFLATMPDRWSPSATEEIIGYLRPSDR